MLLYAYNILYFFSGYAWHQKPKSHSSSFMAVSRLSYSLSSLSLAPSWSTCSCLHLFILWRSEKLIFLFPVIKVRRDREGVNVYQILKATRYTEKGSNHILTTDEKNFRQRKANRETRTRIMPLIALHEIKEEPMAKKTRREVCNVDITRHDCWRRRRKLFHLLFPHARHQSSVRCKNKTREE